MHLELEEREFAGVVVSGFLGVDLKDVENAGGGRESAIARGSFWAVERDRW